MESQLEPIPTGASTSHLRAMAVKLRWVSMASFGSPVVPEVWIMTATSSGRPRQSSEGKSCGFSRSSSSPRSRSSRKLSKPGVVAVRAHPRGVHVDDGFDEPQPRAGLEQLVDLLLVLGDDHGGLEALQGLGQFVGDG